MKHNLASVSCWNENFLGCGTRVSQAAPPTPPRVGNLRLREKKNGGKGVCPQSKMLSWLDKYTITNTYWQCGVLWRRGLSGAVRLGVSVMGLVPVLDGRGRAPLSPLWPLCWLPTTTPAATRDRGPETHTEQVCWGYDGMRQPASVAVIVSDIGPTLGGMALPMASHYQTSLP